MKYNFKRIHWAVDPTVASGDSNLTNPNPETTTKSLSEGKYYVSSRYTEFTTKGKAYYVIS